MSQRLVFSILVLLSSFAFAAKKSNPQVDPNTDENYSVPVQETGAQISGSQMDYAPRAVDYVINTSTWLPNNFSRPSMLNSNSQFADGSVPQIGITRVAPITYALGGVFEYEIGFSYAQLVRTGSVDSGVGPMGATETINLAFLKLGGAYRLPSLGTRYLQPSVDLALLPTWMSSEKSEFEAYGVSATGVILEASLNLLYCPDFMQKAGYAYKNTGEGFGVGYMLTAGSVGGSDLGGGGLQAILRLTL